MSTAHGHPVVRTVVDGWVEERSTPFDPERRGKDQGCRLCDPAAVLLRYKAPVPEAGA